MKGNDHEETSSYTVGSSGARSVHIRWLQLLEEDDDHDEKAHDGTSNKVTVAQFTGL
jgi:hypothetical protein